MDEMPEDLAALWDAINCYAEACGGTPGEQVHGNARRQQAVAGVEQALSEYVAGLSPLSSRPFEAGPSPDARWLVSRWETLSQRPYGTTAGDDLHTADRIMRKAKSRDVASKWLRAWLDDDWVRKVKPKLRHLEDNLQRYAVQENAQAPQTSEELGLLRRRAQSLEATLATLKRVNAPIDQIDAKTRELAAVLAKLRGAQ